MLFVFGLNPFLKFLPMPQLEGVWGQFLGALFVSHFVWLVGATQVVSGALLLIGRFVPLAIEDANYNADSDQLALKRGEHLYHSAGRDDCRYVTDSKAGRSLAKHRNKN